MLTMDLKAESLTPYFSLTTPYGELMLMPFSDCMFLALWPPGFRCSKAISCCALSEYAIGILPVMLLLR